MIGSLTDYIGRETGESVGKAVDHVVAAADAETWEQRGERFGAAFGAVGRPAAVAVLFVGGLYFAYRAFGRVKGTVVVGLPFALGVWFMPHATDTGVPFAQAALTFTGAGAVAYTLLMGFDRVKLAVSVFAPPLVALALIRAWRPDVLLTPEAWVAGSVVAVGWLLVGGHFLRDLYRGEV